VNLLNFAKDERIADCRAVRDFTADHFLMMATRNGLVKKTPLEAYGRPMKGGIIAIKLKDEDELVDVVITKPGDEVVLSTASGMAIRFKETDARPMGRNTSGVKGIKLTKGDRLVGMVVADPEATLLTACAKGYGKRTLFGPNSPVTVGIGPAGEGPLDDSEVEEPTPVEEEEGPEDTSSQQRYRTQRRGGKGLRDIKTTERNGPVIGVTGVRDDDELLMMTARGKIQRIAAREISVIGRNTQGVRIMSLDEEDSLAAIVRVPRDEAAEEKTSE
jgi:DNA gyrase subunit A